MRYKEWIWITCNVCKKKIEVSPSLKNRKYCSERCKGIGVGRVNKGRTLSPQQKRKISEAKMGHKVTPEHRKKLSTKTIDWWKRKGKVAKSNYYHKLILEQLPKSKCRYFYIKERPHKKKYYEIKKCQICGFPFTRLLDFHHVNGKDGSGEVKRICSNCHNFIHRYELSFEEAEKRIKFLQNKGFWFR